jgi:hypothetical protein
MIGAVHLFLALMASTTVVGERTVGIRVELRRCGEVHGAVEVVLDDNEETQLTLDREKPGGHYWTGTWQDQRPKKFPGEPLHGSLRFASGRSYGRIAHPTKGLLDEPIANFIFTCDDAPVRHLDIKTVKPTVFSYERRLPLAVLQTDGLDWGGPERGTVASGFRVIQDLRYPTETLSLKFHNAVANATTSDLLVFNPDGKDAAAAVSELLHPDIIRNATIGPTPNCAAGAVCLGREKLIVALGQQRTRARSRFVSNAYALDQANLAKLTVLTLTVK